MRCAPAQGRLATLHELCLRGGAADPRALALALPGPPYAALLGPVAAAQQQRALAALATPELLAASAPAAGCGSGSLFKPCGPPPRDLVRALRELATVRRERDRLAAQARARPARSGSWACLAALALHASAVTLSA